ncbi:DUF4339 domain-containing protein [Paucibacter sp. AS339]|uniref:DUF4339 domain-containing protein n=1 Tax=Paucibacter hankyongi TaxID=3133434 RepID=UPI0030AD4F46
MTENNATRETLWYYEQSGQHIGPAPTSVIQALVLNSTVSASTLVWRSGWADWTPMGRTELGALLSGASAAATSKDTSDTKTWHYEQSGQRKGPVTQAEMHAMIEKGHLTHGSLVWRAGMPAWSLVEDTELRSQLLQGTPPPLSGEAINNSVVWLLALSPVLIELLRYFIALIATGGNEARADRLVSQDAFWVVGPVISIALSYWDVSVLKKAGVNTQLLGQAWLVPVYLFKRSKALTQSPAYACVWIGLFVLSLFAGA